MCKSVSNSGEQDKVKGQVCVWKVGRALAAVEMCGQSEQAPCVPQLWCLVWLKPRVGGDKIRDPERKALRQKNCVEQARTGAQGRLPWGSVCTQPRVGNIMCRGLW